MNMSQLNVNLLLKCGFLWPFLDLQFNWDFQLFLLNFKDAFSFYKGEKNLFSVHMVVSALEDTFFIIIIAKIYLCQNLPQSFC